MYCSMTQHKLILISQIVYLPSKPTEELSSFNAPILSLQDTYVRAPFFGANYWAAVVKPTPGGGIPSDHPILELKLTFREGGAFDWHGLFEQIKERLYYARQAAQESGRPLDPTGEVNLEQLPAYEVATEGRDDDGRPPAFQSSPDRNEISTATVPNGGARARPDSFQPPDEPPPGYEEAQAQAVEVTFEERERRRVEMGREGDEETESTVSRSPEQSRASRQSLSEARAGGRP